MGAIAKILKGTLWTIAAVLALGTVANLWEKTTETPAQRQEREARETEQRLVSNTKYAAQQHITKSARDPDSVTFGRIDVVFDPFATACGHFNAKNGFGGMTGMTGFVYSPQANTFRVDQGSVAERTAFRSAWSTYCGGTYPTVKSAKG
jgi:hypothetical protein